LPNSLFHYEQRLHWASSGRHKVQNQRQLTTENGRTDVVTFLIPGRTPAIMFKLTARIPRKSTPLCSGLYGVTISGPSVLNGTLMALSEG
jgi:hypothetical protein